jgi:outer membrane receptor protein involved in Fe transport
LRTADAGRLRGTRINAGIAYDGADTPESGDKPPLSMLHNWGARAGFTSLTANGRVLLHGGVSRRVRFPALRELYSGALGRFEPNPDLVPEKLVAAEAGSTWRLGRGEVQAVAFYHVLSDAIVRTSVAGGRFKRVNRDRQSATGAELLATVGIEAVSLGAELTIQDTWLSDDRGVASEPEYQPDVVAGCVVAVRRSRRRAWQVHRPANVCQRGDQRAERHCFFEAGRRRGREIVAYARRLAVYPRGECCRGQHF